MQTRFALPFAILIAVSNAACSTEWAAQPLPPGPQPAPIAGRVRVIRSSGEQLYLASAEVRGDSLYGTRTYSVEDPRIALPLTDVARIEEARPAAPCRPS
jgi:hypothetical protein